MSNRMFRTALLAVVMFVAGFAAAVGIARSSAMYTARSGIVGQIFSSLHGLFYDVIDPDRPPIIVRSGSIHVDGGDPGDTSEPAPRNWVSTTARDWHPDQTAFAVGHFEVSVSGATETDCQPKVNATSVDIDHVHTTGGSTSTSTVTVALRSGEPVVTSTVDLTQDASEPWKLVYVPAGSTPPNDGDLTEARLTRLSGGSLTCHFNADKHARVRLKPKR